MKSRGLRQYAIIAAIKLIVVNHVAEKLKVPSTEKLFHFTTTL
jgi:hypothetical protein